MQRLRQETYAVRDSSDETKCFSGFCYRNVQCYIVFSRFFFRSGSNLAEVDDGSGASPVNLFMRGSIQTLHP